MTLTRPSVRTASVRTATPWLTSGVGSVAPLMMPPYTSCEEDRGEDRPDDLGDDVARDTPPGEVAAHGEGQRDRRVQVGAADGAHEEDDAHDHHAGRQGLHRQGQVATERGRPDDTAAGGDEHEEERPPDLAEQSPELEARVVEVDLVLTVLGGASFEPRQDGLAGRAARSAGSHPSPSAGRSPESGPVCRARTGRGASGHHRTTINVRGPHTGKSTQGP